MSASATFDRAVHLLTQAAQAACQSRNGSNPQATAAQHARDLDLLALALAQLAVSKRNPSNR